MLPILQFLHFAISRGMRVKSSRPCDRTPATFIDKSLYNMRIFNSQ